MKSKPLAKLTDKEPLRVERLTHFATLPKALKASLAKPKAFKGGVVVDRSGSPRYFVFDTYSLWDFLCATDAVFEEKVSAEEYVFRNPVGWLIDAIERHLPIDGCIVDKLKKDLIASKKVGTIPLERLEKELELS